MTKIILWVAVIAVLLISGFHWLNNYIYEEKQEDAAEDYRDAEYIFSGERVKLTNGVGETQTALGASGRTVIRYFGNEMRTDLNNDGREDVVFLMTQELGGSGTFLYAVAALNTERGYVGSEAVLLGDRIAPQTTEVRDGLVIINYADRASGEPMTARPSVGKSMWLKFDANAMRFGEVVQNFEGESNLPRGEL